MQLPGNIKSIIQLTTAFLISLVVSVSAAEHVKPRVIATTDGELDDQSSMVRFLMYASDYDVEGIVQVNGVQKDGHSKDHWIEALIAKYAECLPNLKKHNPDYPDADYLLSVLKVGNENRNDLGKAPPLLSDSEGARLIIQVLLDSDPRPVHILAWGGANTQANALWQIKTKYPDKWPAAAAKARLYCIWYQDGGGLWIQNNLPEVKMYASCVTVNVSLGTGKNNDASWRYVWDYMSVDYYWKNRLSQNPKEIQTIMDKPWLAANIKTGHGPLAAAYSQEYTSEGDSPSFMPLVDNGLQQDTDYTLGGWGGRPVYDVGNILIDGGDENAGNVNFHYTFYRWLPAIQNDWAARADWCVATTYADANHQPVVVLGHAADLKVQPGTTVELSAKGTSDPDGNDLAYRWWQYHEADSYDGTIEILNSDKQEASFTVPGNAELGKSIHIICEVTDNGTPQLTTYQRVIIETLSSTKTDNMGFTPTRFDLKLNYPNPFNPATTIQYNLNKPNHITLKIYNLSGQEIETLVNQYQSVGEHEITWQPRGLPSGMYFCGLHSGQIFSETMKLVLQK